MHVSGTVGTCYTFGGKATHRNDGEIDFMIGAAIAEGSAFYRVLIADTDDANLRAYSGIIELTGVVAEGASSPGPAAAADTNDASQSNDDTLTIVLVIVGSVLGACVVISGLAATLIAIVCARKKKAADSRAREPVVEGMMMASITATNPMPRSSPTKTRLILIDRTSATAAMLEEFDSVNIDPDDIAIDMEDFIGEGAFGKVFGAKLRRGGIDHSAAVKIVKPSLAAAHGISAMYPAFIKEVTLMKKACDASQNGVCRLFGAVAVNDSLGIVMKRYHHSLQDEITQALPGTIEIDRIINIAWTIARAASFIHKIEPPMLLRDIKPDNILIDSDGEAVIADFGCAGQVGMGAMQSSGQSGLSVVSSHLVGTTRYMAPEQVGWRYESGMEEIGMAKVKRHAGMSLLSRERPSSLVLTSTHTPSPTFIFVRCTCRCLGIRLHVECDAQRQVAVG